MTTPTTLHLQHCHDLAVVGGKAVNLGRLVRAGFTVPQGFAITTHAYRAATAAKKEGERHSMPAGIAADIVAAYRAMGQGPVAVRSSATAEDLAEASMAGQYETFLDIEGEEALLDRVVRCWESLHSPRIRAYFQRHGIDAAQVAMGVVVQRLAPAEVAGVLFTSDPAGTGQARGDGGSDDCVLIEATWGLGETLVAGHVQPDVFRLDKASGRILEATIGDKRVELVAGAQGRRERPVEEARRRQATLDERRLWQLWELGEKAAAHFGRPQDIEWALGAGEEGVLYLLQSRPITTLRDFEVRERELEGIRHQLRQQTAAGRGPWVLHNLAETLAHPAPLTWSVIARFMSGAGGFGEMYRQAGFQPSERIREEGFLELIGGRIYMDVSRATEMFAPEFPYAYDLETLKRSPDASQSPPTLPRGTLRNRLKAGRMLAAVTARLRVKAAGLDRELRESTFPAIERYVGDARSINLGAVNDLTELWMKQEEQVFDRFAPRLLLPSLISGMALADLRNFLVEVCWREDPDALAQFLSSASGGAPTRTLLADAGLYQVGRGAASLDDWIRAHGHRGPNEFDLAAPRWREQPDLLREAAVRLATGEDPLERHRRQSALVEQRIAGIRKNLSSRDRSEFDRCLDLVRRYLPFREESKDFLILGYGLLREIALEAGRRLGIGTDLFFLHRQELFEALRNGAVSPNHKESITARKVAHRAQARLQLPTVIDSSSIENLGKAAELPARAASASGHKAFPISSGQARGTVRVLHSPTQAADVGTGYILVCPSTDPSWTPLFAHAAGLIIECGGTLSHGAVVAREMGLPAAVLPDATRLFADGDELFVDGTTGWVGKTPAAAAAAIDPGDTRIRHDRVPPLASRKDRTAGHVRNAAAALWLLFLLAFFTLPGARVEQPTLHAIDLFLWPLVRHAGKPATVAIVAAAIAVITLLIQKWGTDNSRLLEAKRRAALLTREAAALPKTSPRRRVLQSVVAQVQLRTLLAAMVPVGILLGPLVLPFVWFTQRIDPAVANAPPGSPVTIVALVDATLSESIRLSGPPGLSIDPATPADRTLPPLRPALEHLLALYRAPVADAWELQLAPELPPGQAAADLQEYLARGLPPQGITWIVHPGEDAAGRFDLSIDTPSAPDPMPLAITLGDDQPPAPRIVHPVDSPIRELKIVYPRSATMQPFVRFGPLHCGWVLLYILVYVPVLFAARAVLKVA
jgi:pyruvate,water dikinase